MSQFYFLVADSGEGPGGPVPPLLLDQNEVRGAKKSFFGDRPPPYIRVWMTAAPHPSQGLDPALFSMCLQHDLTKSGIIWVDFRLVSKTVTFEKCEADLPMKLFMHPTYQNLLI